MNQSNQYRIAALYRFVDLPDFARLKAPLVRKMVSLNIKGTILLAREGVNGTVAAAPHALDSFIDWLRNDAIWNGQLRELEVKFSTADTPPFARGKVKLKQEIVTMGVAGIDPTQSVGTYVKPEDWNALISQPDVTIIDTRNDYEVKLGRFKGAANPATSTFREFPAFAEKDLDPAHHKKVAMYCTGGIRCEKSTAYLKSLGFEEVFHLQGGILKYLEEVPKEQSLWEGECFVFDERIAVDHDLKPGGYVQCHACRLPLTPEELDHPHYVEGESCPNCYPLKTDAQRARYRERDKQIRLARHRGEKHTGDEAKRIQARRRAAKLKAKEDQRRRQEPAS